MRVCITVLLLLTTALVAFSLDTEKNKASKQSKLIQLLKSPPPPPSPPAKANDLGQTKEDVLKRPADFKNCRSEGGSWNCARCRERDGSGGVLPCDAVPKNCNTGCENKPSYQDCPDSLTAGKFFVQGGASLGWDGKARCESFSDDNAIHRTTLVTKKFNYGLHGEQNWGRKGAGAIDLVLTKPAVGHVHGASLHEGYIMFKRTVYHTGGKNTELADVFKIGYCVRCPLIPMEKFVQQSSKASKSKKGSGNQQMESSNADYFGDNPISNWYGKAPAISYGFLSSDGTKRAVFHSTRAQDATLTEKKVFVEECVMHAFDKMGLLKNDYQCSTEVHTKNPDRGLWQADYSGAEAFKNQFSTF